MNAIFDLLQNFQNDTENFERGSPFTEVVSSFLADRQVSSSAAISDLKGLLALNLFVVSRTENGLSPKLTVNQIVNLRTT